MPPVVSEILVSVGKTFAVMAVGALLRRRGQRDISVASDLAMTVFVPCLAFSVILESRVSSSEIATIAGATLSVLVLVGLVAAAVLRLLGLYDRLLLLPIVFMNSANLPFPILEANYGETGLGYGIIAYMVVQPLVFSVGLLFAGARPDVRTLLETPVFVASILAVGLKMVGWTPPTLVMQTTGLLGEAAIPLILLTFGYSLAGVRLRAWRTTLVASVLRLGGGLGAGWVIATLFGLDGPLRDSIILVAAMPSAVITVVVARHYRADHELVASIVFATTLAALVVLPLLLLGLRT